MKWSNPHIEKSYDLPQSNLSKIQSLYKQILSAAEDPTIVDWVKACEVKIKSMEQEIDGANKALKVTQSLCEDYQKKVVAQIAVYTCQFDISFISSKIGGAL